MVQRIQRIAHNIMWHMAKAKEVMASFRGLLGFGIGLVGILAIISKPLVEKVLRVFGFAIGTGSTSGALRTSPFFGLSLTRKILLAPLVCIVTPIAEEELFRGTLQDILCDRLKPFYGKLGFSDAAAYTTARITSVFFAVLAFGLIHFSNALLFWCHPVLFLPQVVSATIAGLFFSLAKEISGDLLLPMGMHMGHNTLVWIYYIVYDPIFPSG